MTTEKVVSKRIEVHSEKCVGCCTCMLECSFSKMQMFIPSESRIVIDWEDYQPKISFTNDCDECGICVRNCVWGALTLND